MATRFTATGQWYTAAIGGGVQTIRTMSAWIKIMEDANRICGILGIDDGTSGGGDYSQIATLADGTSVRLTDTTNGSPGTPLALNVWHYVGVSSNGSTSTLYVRPDNSPTWTVQAVGGAEASMNCQLLTIGDDIFGGVNSWLRGAECGVKLWLGASLSQAEHDAEYSSLRARRRANLAAEYPLFFPETRDYSGNNKTLTGGVGASYEPGPAALGPAVSLYNGAIEVPAFLEGVWDGALVTPGRLEIAP